MPSRTERFKQLQELHRQALPAQEFTDRLTALVDTWDNEKAPQPLPTVTTHRKTHFLTKYHTFNIFARRKIHARINTIS